HGLERARAPAVVPDGDAQDPHALGRRAGAPAAHDVLEDGGQVDANVPRWIVRAHLGQVGDVADVVAFAILVEVLVLHGLSGDRPGSVESLPDGAGILA